MDTPAERVSGTGVIEVGLPATELLAAMFTDLGAGLYLTDRDGRITTVNPRAVASLQRPASALVGADAHDLLHRNLRGAPLPRPDCALRTVIEQGRTVRGDDECDAFLSGTGRLRPTAWMASPLRLKGQICGAAVLFIDADDREEAARRQDDQLATLQRLTERLSAVTDISTVLTQTSQVQETLEQLGRLIVPRLADWAAVDLSTGPDEVCRVTVVAPIRSADASVGGASPDGAPDRPAGRVEPVVWQGPLPPVTDISSAPLARVLRSGEALLLGPDDIAAADDTPLGTAHSELFAAFGAASVIVVPLRTPRRVLGALTAGRIDPARPFDMTDLTLMTDIGGRVGLTAENARLCTQQRDVTTAMQRHVLTPPPQVSPLQLAARYRPASQADRVGGDWYDAFLLSSGVTALSVGGVAGHDLSATADMAQLRGILRSLAWDHEEPPSRIIDLMDEAVQHTTDVVTATVILARVEQPDGGPWQVHWVSAGHPPPLLITAEGRTRYLHTGQNVLLGVGLAEGESRHDAIEPLPAAGTLLLYTGGLIEMRGGDPDIGMNRLCRQAAALARHPVEKFCDQLLIRMTADGAVGADDIALLALRLPDEETGT